MRKTLYTLNLQGKYSPEICAMTYPLMKKYADRCGAEFFIIDDDKFPGWPLTANKFQVYDLSRERKDTWSIFMDSDTIIHNDMPDITELIPMDTVFHHNADFAACRWRPDDFFRRDGRQISSASWIMIASSWCRDFLRSPTEQVTDDGLGFMTKEEIVHRILLNAKELDYGLPPEHLIDDYTFSRNIARFGLKFTTIHQISEKWKLPFRGLAQVPDPRRSQGGHDPGNPALVGGGWKRGLRTPRMPALPSAGRAGVVTTARRWKMTDQLRRRFLKLIPGAAAASVLPSQKSPRRRSSGSPATVGGRSSPQHRRKKGQKSMSFALDASASGT